MKALYIIVLALILGAANVAAQTVYGYVSDSKTGERLPGALIINGKNNSTALTNSYGYFSLPKAAKGDTLLVRFLGYNTQSVAVGEAARIDIALNESNNMLTEVEVKAKSTFRRELSSAQMSHHRINSADIKAAPMLFGEADALKTIQIMPGVNSAADGSTNLSVRGGSYDQNLILLDEATVYNPSHTMGIFTAFNADAISSVDFFKGDIPARYGGKLSAVVDMQMKEGNNQQFKAQGGIGLISSRLLVEGPLKRGVASFMASGRFGYSDALVKGLSALNDFGPDFLYFDEINNYTWDHENDRMRFYDICAKANWNIDQNNKVYASGYLSKDRFLCPMLSQENDQTWANQTATLRWNHTSSDNMFVNTTLTYSNYNYRQRQAADVRNYEWHAGMGEVVAKADADYYLERMHITFGAALEGHSYNPGEIVPLNDSSLMKAMQIDKKKMALVAAYAGNEHRVTDQLTLSYGLRLASAFHLGPTTVRHYTDMPHYTDSTHYSGGQIAKGYFGLEPRLSLSYSLSDNMTLKASYAHTKQYQHLLNNSALGLPTDIWAPADSYIKPQSADAFAVGVHGYLPVAQIEASAEAYYKKMHDVIDFRDNAELELNSHIETEVLSGEGRAYGLELMLRRDSRRTSFVVSYTLSEAKRRIDGVNYGKWYYAVYDQRHNLSVNAMWRMSDQWSLSGSFKYHTGGRTTLPVGSFYYQGAAFSIYTERNGYKMPDCHRLDMSVVYDFKQKPDRRFHSQLALSVYNVYSHKNPYSIYVKNDAYSMDHYQGYMLYMYLCVPTISYNFSF
ncbi:MAG: TonB-dependent receptor [Bacteroidales bacterium]|nr:TonB-dependent receptor [Bacteroidales bacterium]